MKIAVLSDIHGNYIALEKCLEHAKSQKITTYFFLGDYLGEFPYPQKTMNMLYEMNEKYECFFIRGNKEDYWINRRTETNCDWKYGNHGVNAMISCYENLTAKDIDFFETMPVCQNVQFPGTAAVLLCHGNPANNRGTLLPEDEPTQELINQYSEQYIVHGHTHIQGVFKSNGKTILNAGSVGVPLHQKKRTQYMILTSENQEWNHRFVSLDYAFDTVIKELHESGLWEVAPYWCRVTKHLLYTGEISHGTALLEAMKANGYKDHWYNVGERYWEEAFRVLGID